MRSLASCYFGGDQWDRMARVLRHSAQTHCPSWDVRVERIVPTERHSPLGVPNHSVNASKFDWWAARVAEAPDGAELLLIDADTVVLASLDDAWAQPFDLAVTERPRGARFPLNGGVVFLRVNERSRVFVARWHAEGLRLLRSPVRSILSRWGGITQAALGVLLESDHGAEVARLDCAEWNREDSTWAAPGAAKILHVKSQLRAEVFKPSRQPRLFHRQRSEPDSLGRWVSAWREAERAAKGGE